MKFLQKGDAWLATPNSIDDASTLISERHLNALRTTANWATDYLCKKHPLLGREGPVCPFTQPAMRKKTFWLTAIETKTPDMAQIEKAVMTFQDWFLELPPTESPDNIYKTILIVFPDIPNEQAPETIDRVQRKLKPAFVANGLMLGQFYTGCKETGIWNKNFHPFESPIPLLAIRHMVPADFPFLVGPRSETGWLISYFAKFAADLPLAVRQQIATLLTQHSTNHGVHDSGSGPH